ncbi:MAG: cation:proton antiporter [Sphingobacteriales bacterium]|nr:cation:proton antiporter [Sphingobacteriales bacterium]
MNFDKFSFPTDNPVLVLLILVVIAYLAPLLFRKISLPGIIGLIISGIVVGPEVLNLMDRNLIVLFFQKIGILYLMFLASFEIDIKKFRQNSLNSILFGLLTLIIPFVIGFLTSVYLLQLDTYAAFFVAAMFSTHTLVAYPVVSRMGIINNPSVSVVVGGTIITNSLVLLSLALFKEFNQGLSDFSLLYVAGSLILFLLLVLFLLPKAARWLFKNTESDRGFDFLLVMFFLLFSAVLAELSNIDGIVGAFLIGLALNRIIPMHNALRNRIRFFGNTFFIPFFLISIGMMTNINAFYSGTQTIIFGVVFIVFGIFSKWLAAFFIQLFAKFNANQRNLIFGLSTTHAAATIAVIMIGIEAGIVNETVLNAAVLLILITCLLGGIITERAGKNIVIQNSSKDEPETAEIPSRILVPIANPATVHHLIEVASVIYRELSAESIYLLSVVNDDEEAYQKVHESRKMMEKLIEPQKEAEIPINIRTKIDLSVPNGISRAIKEHTISTVVMGWSGKKGTFGKIFGTTLDNLLISVNEELIICKFEKPLMQFNRVHWLIPTNFSFEPGFESLFKKFLSLARQIPDSPVFYSDNRTLNLLRKNQEITSSFSNPVFTYSPYSEKFRDIFNTIDNQSLVLIMLSRKGCVSHRPEHDLLPHLIDQDFSDMNVIIAYPKQFPDMISSIILPEEDIGLDPIQDNIDRLGRIGNNVRRLLRIR